MKEKIDCTLYSPERSHCVNAEITAEPVVT